ncbi:MAG: hypothetical protein A3D92_07915 [Bacteroidetes bacterium RIFCSPHIGHO2_02_FULL_44_7]|nr:MAG: hypothetical protein A3D92_07915 [Bacteroidetes bacterium RIFCSPHIGHO2_02_FULL_44_7]
MRRILPIFFLLVVLPAWGQVEYELMKPLAPARLSDYTLHACELRGPVRSSTYRYFEANYVNGRIEKGSEAENPEIKYDYYTTFTKRGFVESVIDLRDLQGTINFKDSLLFNAEGMPIRMTRYFRDGRVKFYESFEYTHGKMTRWAAHRQEHIQNDLVCTYSADGNILSELETDFYYPEPYDMHSMADDTQNRVLAQRYYHYDEQGRLHKRISGEFQTEYFYSVEGKPVKRSSRNEGDEWATWEISGDSLIYRELTSNGNSHVHLTHFNPQGDPVEKRFYANGTLTRRETYMYVYDEQGNWISRCFGSFDCAYPTYWCDERVITYHE